jgi:hypothetical protein
MSEFVLKLKRHCSFIKDGQITPFLSEATRFHSKEEAWNKRGSLPHLVEILSVSEAVRKSLNHYIEEYRDGETAENIAAEAMCMINVAARGDLKTLRDMAARVSEILKCFEGQIARLS